MLKGHELMPKKTNIGTNFVLVTYFGEVEKKMSAAADKAVAQATIIAERSAKKNTPFRTGTNSRSIISEVVGGTGIIRTTSGYGFWLEVVDRTYDEGHKGYLREAYHVASDQLATLTKIAFLSSPVRFPRPRI